MIKYNLNNLVPFLQYNCREGSNEYNDSCEKLLFSIIQVSSCTCTCMKIEESLLCTRIIYIQCILEGEILYAIFYHRLQKTLNAWMDTLLI